MPCPNCGFVSAPGTMFCGKCGTRLAAAPAPQTPYQPSYQAPASQQPQSQMYSGYTPAQRPAYTPTAEPSVPYSSADAPARPVYPSYSAPMMQSPYISGAARASAPVLSSSREGAAQYTAVSTNVYSPQAKAAAVASENATKKKKAGKVILTIFSVLLVLGMGAAMYFSGIFNQPDNSIYIPEASGDVQTETVKPDKPQPDTSTPGTENTSPDAASDTDTEINPETDNSAVPGGLGSNDLASANAFISAFTEAGMTNIGSTVSPAELVEFAIAGLSLNSSVFDYSTDGFASGDITYNYSIPESYVNQRIARYFGNGVQIYPAIGDSGNGWMYYGSSYYFTQPTDSKGFALITEYKESGDMVNVSFNVYSPQENEAQYYSMTAKKAENAGCTLIGTGSAVLGKTSYNGRDTYIISSMQTAMN